MNANKAILSNVGDMTSFSYGGTTLRFLSCKNLVRYTRIKKWDAGYIEVMADYGEGKDVEEYIDLRPILRNMLISPARFLKPIRKVEVSYDE